MKMDDEVISPYNCCNFEHFTQTTTINDYLSMPLTPARHCIPRLNGSSGARTKSFQRPNRYGSRSEQNREVDWFDL